jgi:hypothetical protein
VTREFLGIGVGNRNGDKKVRLGMKGVVASGLVWAGFGD